MGIFFYAPGSHGSQGDFGAAGRRRQSVCFSCIDIDIDRDKDKDRDTDRDRDTDSMLLGLFAMGP